MSIRFLPTPLKDAPESTDWRSVASAQKTVRRDGAVAGALIAHGAASDNRSRLLEGGALAVTTGQQAGLFTGPLFSVLKALSAAALAHELNAAGNGPVVPVFWVAGDDHDFAEINHCYVTGQDGRVTRIVLRERAADAPMLAAYREPVGPEGAVALAALEALLPPGDARSSTMDLLRRAYAPDHSLAEANALAMAELLGPYGLVVCRGWDGTLKKAAKDVLLRAAKGAAKLDAGLLAEAELLRARGANVPVEVGQGLTLLMIEGRQGRDRLRIAGNGFETRRGGEAFSLADLERIAAEEPERLSGNVLLRPAVEATVFPTVGYFGGPGELAYLAQTGPVFQQLGVPRPARLARLSGLLVEAKVDKILEKNRLTPSDLATDEGALISRVARDALPGSAAAALAELRAAITSHYATLQAEAVAVERTLEKPVENMRNQALVGTQEIEKKLLAALKRANETAVQQVVRARDQLFPEGTPQERVISAVSFVGRHGTAVLDLLFDAARAHARRHLEGPPGRT